MKIIYKCITEETKVINSVYIGKTRVLLVFPKYAILKSYQYIKITRSHYIHVVYSFEIKYNIFIFLF